MLLIGILTKKSSLNWIMMPNIVLIVEAKWRNMTFKNHRRFLTLKQLVCLLEFSLENALSVLENSGLRDRYFQEKSPNTSYHQPKDCSEADWEDFYDRHCSSASHFNFNLSFASPMTFTLSMIFLGFQRLCLGMSIPYQGKDEFHCARFWQSQYHHRS